MTTTNFILLLNACTQLLASFTNLVLAIQRAVELRRWRRRTLRGLRRRRHR
jgi:hypothetical protein